VDTLFFFLSGENNTLPASEIKAILEAEGFHYEVLNHLDQVLRLRVGQKALPSLTRRLAYTKFVGFELFMCKDELKEILNSISSCSQPIFNEKTTFAVRVKHVKSWAPHINSESLEKKIGGLILKENSKSTVDLQNPEITLFGILTNGYFIFGIRLAQITAKSFNQRSPKFKPFFHPTAMKAKLARGMVNLSQSKVGDLVFDPFTGTGSILIEAALIGSRILGVDVRRSVARGALRNFRHFDLNSEGIIVADSRHPPLIGVDCIVTDPPYGRSSITLKRKPAQIIEEMLTATYDLLKPQKRICLAAPNTLQVSRIAKAVGYTYLESHFVFVHRSLLREILVLQKR
jgi:tRNA (guanine10-N2)-dimethyltransferase